MPVVSVIVPEAHAAVQATRNRRIGLLATELTVASGRYEHARPHTRRRRSLHVGRVSQARAADRGGDTYSDEVVAAVREYAAPLKEAGCDTVILGCTHYPLLRPVFQRAFGRDVTLVFSADETAREVAETLARKGFDNSSEREGSYRFLTTGDPGCLPRARRAVPAAADRRCRAGRRRRARGGRVTRERRAAARPAPPGGRGSGVPRAAARSRALVAGEDARALHRDGAGRRSALALALRPRLDDGRVLAAARPRRASGPTARRHAASRAAVPSRSSG